VDINLWRIFKIFEDRFAPCVGGYKGDTGNRFQYQERKFVHPKTGKWSPYPSKAYFTLAALLALTLWQPSQVSLFIRLNILSWSHHFEVAKLDEPAQCALLALAEQNSLSVRDLRAAVREYKRNTWLEEKGVDIQTVDINVLPAGMYRIVYADPPWAYGNSVSEIATDAANYYPSMPTEEICALPVNRLAYYK